MHDALVIDIVWIATDSHGALPGHHWQGTIFNSGSIEYQRRYLKKHLAMQDALAWLEHRTEVEQEIATMSLSEVDSK